MWRGNSFYATCVNLNYYFRSIYSFESKSNVTWLINIELKLIHFSLLEKTLDILFFQPWIFLPEELIQHFITSKLRHHRLITSKERKKNFIHFCTNMNWMWYRRRRQQRTSFMSDTINNFSAQVLESSFGLSYNIFGSGLYIFRRLLKWSANLLEPKIDLIENLFLIVFDLEKKSLEIFFSIALFSLFWEWRKLNWTHIIIDFGTCREQWRMLLR